MSNVDNLISIIKDSPLSNTTKEFYADKIAREGATQENLSAVRKLLEEIQATAASNLGITIDLQDPDLKASQEKLEHKVQAATDTYVATMKKLESANARIGADISADLASLEKLVVESAKAEA